MKNYTEQLEKLDFDYDFLKDQHNIIKMNLIKAQRKLSKAYDEAKDLLTKDKGTIQVTINSLKTKVAEYQRAETKLRLQLGENNSKRQELYKEMYDNMKDTREGHFVGGGLKVDRFGCISMKDLDNNHKQHVNNVPFEKPTKEKTYTCSISVLGFSALVLASIGLGVVAYFAIHCWL